MSINNNKSKKKSKNKRHYGGYSKGNAVKARSETSFKKKNKKSMFPAAATPAAVAQVPAVPTRVPAAAAVPQVPAANSVDTTAVAQVARRLGIVEIVHRN